MRNTTRYWSDFLKNLKSRAVDEALGSVFFHNAPLNRWLRRTLSAEGPDAQYPLLGEPLFEAVFPWKLAGKSCTDLVREGLLHQSLIDHKLVPPPFEHQYLAYKTFLNDPHTSAIISSGTGSGKTECFMVPIIESIAREIDAKQNVQGIRALFLYPLNALIVNQQKRLNRFTGPFNGAIRYALYTGELEEDAANRATADIHPAELYSRKLMRREMPHLLVTNPTMLEYMLLRKADAGMIEATRRNNTFKWVVLDEAHTYIGTRAAEMALLLRRVLNAFNVSPNDVHFVATSATVDAKDLEKLRRFLVDLSGADDKNVHIILGQREFPRAIAEDELSDEESLEDLLRIADTEDDRVLREHLMHSRTAIRIRNEFLKEPHYLKFSQIEKLVHASSEETLLWLDLLTKPSGKKNQLLPLRLQQMMSTTDIINVCPNRECPEKVKDEDLNDPAWRFGTVWLDGRHTCSCGAPLFPLAACSHCSSVSLRADLVMMRDGSERLVRPDDEVKAAESWRNFEHQGTADLFETVDTVNDPEAEEELKNDKAEIEKEKVAERKLADAAAMFAKSTEDFDSTTHLENMYEEIESANEAKANDFDDGTIVEDQSSAAVTRLRVLITNEPESADNGHELKWLLEDTVRSAKVTFRREIESKVTCPGCGEMLPLSAYYLRRISERYTHALMPLILEYCGTPESPEDYERPMEGRKLLSFTDSRQGTAKSSALIERLGEKSFVASKLYENLSRSSANSAELELAEQELRKFENELQNANLSDFLRQILISRRDEVLSKLAGVAQVRVDWKKMKETLVKNMERNRRCYEHLYRSFNIAGDRVDPAEVADILLLREFGSRPVNGSSLETCGLVRVDYKGLDKAQLPASLDWPLSTEDWRNYLKVVLDYFVRHNHGIKMPSKWRKFGGNSRVFEHQILSPDTAVKYTRGIRWPSVSRTPERSSRIVKFTAKVLGVDLEAKPERSDIERVNEVLRSAFSALRTLEILVRDDEVVGSGYVIKPDVGIEFSLNQFAWRFEGINKLFDTIVGPAERAICPTHVNVVGAVKVALPQLPKFDFDNPTEDRMKIRRFLAESEEFRTLVDSGCWNSSGTLAYERDGYFSSAEHTAQLDKLDRKHYETSFENGSINILASSTTMEMGIDLGKIGAVILNGVPPHPANYMQRIGRAGRRDETRINSFTICHSSPRDRTVFREVDWALREAQPELAISLNSAVIVERHVTAEILGAYIRQRALGNSRLTVGEWLENWSENFKKWISEQNDSQGSSLENQIRKVVRYSALESRSLTEHLKAALEAIEKVVNKDQAEIDRYKRQIEISEEGAYRRALTRRLNGILSEELFKRLAECLALPSSIRVINTTQLERPVDKEEKKTASGRPDMKAGVTTREGRNGIFEYAPGASTVIDGTNYLSCGVRVTWPIPSTEMSVSRSVPNKREWECGDCHERFLAEMTVSKAVCPTCGSLKTASKGKAFLPDGFVVDARRTTKDTTTATYVKHEPNILLDEPWMPISSMGLVQARSSTNANILSINDGVDHGKQARRFAICLACGFAQLMPDATDQNDQWRRHEPLQKTSLVTSDGYCKGGTKESFLFQDAVSFASEWKTDCLQISFGGLSHLFINENDPAPETYRKKHLKSAGIGIAVALRRAIAELYGISEEEMLFSAQERKINGAKRLIVSIYDSAMGGYSSGAADKLPMLFKRAIDILQCRHKNCTGACSACILRFDAQKTGIELNRHDALQVFKANDINRIIRGETIDGLSQNAYPIGRHLPDYLNAALALHDVASVTIFVHQKPRKELMLAWTDIYNFARQLGEGRRGEIDRQSIKFAAVDFDWSELDAEQQNRLSYLAEYGIGFARANTEFYENLPAFRRLIAISTDYYGESRGYFIDAKSEIINALHASWMVEGDGIAIVTAALKDITLPEVVWQSAPEFTPVTTCVSSGVARELSLNGVSVTEFGRTIIQKSVQVLHSDCGRIDEIFDSPIRMVEYTDSYLERAGDAALVLSVFRAIAESADASNAKFIIRTGIPKNRHVMGFGMPNQLYRAWPTEEIRQRVFQELAALAEEDDSAPMRIHLEFQEKALDVHHRQLLIHFENDEALEIFLDQGVGCVEFGRKYLNYTMVRDWAKFLYSLIDSKNLSDVVLRDSKNHPTHLSISRLGQGK